MEWWCDNVGRTDRCETPVINSNIFGVVTTPPMVAGLDVGGTKTNATLLDSKGVFLNNRMVETPSRVLEGPEAAIEAMAKAIELAIGGAGRVLVAGGGGFASPHV